MFPLWEKPTISGGEQLFPLWEKAVVTGGWLHHLQPSCNPEEITKPISSDFWFPVHLWRAQFLGTGSMFPVCSRSVPGLFPFSSRFGDASAKIWRWLPQIPSPDRFEHRFPRPLALQTLINVVVCGLSWW